MHYSPDNQNSAMIMLGGILCVSNSKVEMGPPSGKYWKNFCSLLRGCQLEVGFKSHTKKFAVFKDKGGL